MSKNMDINKCSRNGFKGCYYDAGGYGQFKGEVVQVKENGSDIRYLFKRIYVSMRKSVVETLKFVCHSIEHRI